jgi:putative ABC transport system ATP-binding protein
LSPLVTISDVSKVYGGPVPQAALQDVSFTVEEGEFASVMGPSGSGKSTLLNLIAGLDRATAGQIVVGGAELGRLSEAALARYRCGRVGMIFQFFNLLNNLTALENVMIPARLMGVRARVARRSGQELLEQLGIGDKADKFPATLSGGERQRVAIARAVVNRPALVLADEPTGALDSRNGSQVMDLLVGLNRGGQTILLVTHDSRMAEAYTRRVLTLADGRVVDDARQSAAGGAGSPKAVSRTVKSAP